jgi:hypothetical protein
MLRDLMRPMIALGTVAFSATAAPLMAERIAPQLEAQIEAATAGRIAQIDAAVGDEGPAAAPTPRVRAGERTHAEQRAEQREGRRARRRGRAVKGERRGKRRR